MARFSAASRQKLSWPEAVNQEENPEEDRQFTCRHRLGMSQPVDAHARSRGPAAVVKVTGAASKRVSAAAVSGRRACPLPPATARRRGCRRRAWAWSPSPGRRAPAGHDCTHPAIGGCRLGPQGPKTAEPRQSGSGRRSELPCFCRSVAWTAGAARREADSYRPQRGRFAGPSGQPTMTPDAPDLQVMTCDSRAGRA